MKYLDERIICTLNNLTIQANKLYRYDVVVNEEFDEPVFIGNCFIGAGVQSKTIDITDLVRNYYDFSYPYVDTDFQAEWQVKLYLDDTNTVLSDRIGIYPIYRYPNRKARMETPLSNNELNWYIPALQGFNADKKGEFLPHIPFINSDKVDYNLAVNFGNLRDENPYLYSGVKKTLQMSDFGIYNTQYKLSDLWKGAEVETLDWDFTILNNYITAYYEPPTGYYSFTSLAPLRYKAYVYNVPTSIYDGNSRDTHTPITDFPFIFNAENTGEQQEYPIDLYIEDADTNSLLNIYPSVTKSCKATVRCEIKEDFVNDYTLITNAAGEVTQTDDYWFIDTPLVAELNITFRDERDAIVKTLTISQGNETFSILDTEGIAEFEFSANGQNYDFNLDERCYAGNGCEYIFTFTLDGIDVKIYPIIARYSVDATFRTFRATDVTSTPDNISIIQKDGVDNLTASDIVNFEDMGISAEVLYGNQSVTTSPAKIVSKLGNKVLWSCALCDSAGKMFYSGPFNANFKVVDGNITLYVFGITGTNYEVSKLTTAYLGIIKGITAEMYFFTTLKLTKSNAALNTSSKYQQYVASKSTIEVAKVDSCPARYYLQWRDRYGSMQMQPFNPTIQYKQDFSRLETKNYRETRKLSNLSIQPKWTLNTGFLSDYKYPYYESLLVSPWIKLYDTQEDSIYDVIIKNTDYTEKTYLNQDANLFNLEIEVEQTDKQNILY